MSNGNKALATIDPNIFLTFDRLDDDQIIAEMKGAALQDYVYEFTEGGQTVRGLSKTGTDDASRIMAVKYGEALREVDVTLEFQDEDAAYFKAKVARYVIRDDGTALEMDSAIGQKRQPKKTRKRNGEIIVNSFWYEQGGQKALRNAKQKLMPETIKQAIIAAYVEQGKVRTVKSADIGETSEAPIQRPEHYCEKHAVGFRRFEKNGRVWYSHQDGDGWCNEGKMREVTSEPEKPANGHDKPATQSTVAAKPATLDSAIEPARWATWDKLVIAASRLGLWESYVKASGLAFINNRPVLSKAQLIGTETEPGIGRAFADMVGAAMIEMKALQTEWEALFNKAKNLGIPPTTLFPAMGTLKEAEETVSSLRRAIEEVEAAIPAAGLAEEFVQELAGIQGAGHE